MALFGNTIKKAKPLNSLTFSLIINYGSDDEELYDLPYSNLVSFTHKRNATNQGNTFTMTLQGDLSLDLEYKILAGNKKIYFAYGLQGESTRKFEGEVTSCDIKFEGMATALAISGVVSVYSSDKMTRSCIWKKGTYFSKIMNLICDAHGWQLGNVIDAKPLSEDITQASMTDTEFLSSVLNSRIKTKDGISDYVLWFTYDGSKTILNYAPLCYRGDSVGSYVYDMYGSGESTLLSFELKNNGDAAYSVGTSITSSTIDEDTGEISSSSSSSASSALSSLTEDAKNLYGRRDVFTGSSSSRRVKSNLKSDADTLQDYYWQKLYSFSYEASATFIGDVTLDVGCVISIMIILRDGKVHYSSGNYSITEVEDSIDSSGFITSASLIKYSSNIGNKVTES